MKILGMNPFWKDRPTLVTGATGLVGAWLVKTLLLQRADVVCLVRDQVPQAELFRAGLAGQVRIVAGDITDQPLLERVLNEYEVSTVFHLAAQTIVGVANRNPISTFEANIKGTWALLEAARRCPAVKQIVLASSDKAYGDEETLLYTEDAPLQGRHPYDCSKSCADLLAQCYAATYNLPVAITRCGNFYGGGDLNWNRIVPGTVRSILRGQRPVIRSDGTLIRDYFYVEDGAACYMLLAEQLASRTDELKGQAFNFSTEAPISVLDLVTKIAAVMQAKVQPDIRNEANHEIREQFLSAVRARKLLGWSPRYTLDQGLESTIRWYTEFLRHD